MRWLALATDYDDTLAHEGRVAETTLAALERLRASGRKAVLVTGRVLPELLLAFPRIDLFDRVVAENGALLVRPQARAEVLLAAPPPAAFVERLRSAGVAPLILGRAIVATLAPHEPAVRDAIRALAPDLQIIRNNDAVMVLPAGVDKASGLSRALAELGIAPSRTVAVGDAENDLAMLAACGCGVAVANALGPVKARAAWVTKAERGAGVEEVIDRLLGTWP